MYQEEWQALADWENGDQENGHTDTSVAEVALVFLIYLKKNSQNTDVS